nr:small membrane protein YniD [Serratia marcescens]
MATKRMGAKLGKMVVVLVLICLALLLLRWAAIAFG